MLELLKNAVRGQGGKVQIKGGKELKCPKCKIPVTLNMERCPGCGTHISSMFRIECPSCKENNPINAAACSKCGKSFLSGGPGKHIHLPALPLPRGLLHAFLSSLRGKIHLRSFSSPEMPAIFASALLFVPFLQTRTVFIPALFAGTMSFSSLSPTIRMHEGGTRNFLAIFW